MRVLAVTGLNREARIIAGPGVVALAGGGDGRTLTARIETALGGGFAGIISMGIAGALDASLAGGDAVVASQVLADGRLYPVDKVWSDRLLALAPGSRHGLIAGGEAIIADAAAKAALRAATTAMCVDMESHIAAEAAQRAGLPFAALRFISDGADRALPKAAQLGMKPDGGMDILAVLRSLAADPRQLPALIRTGSEAETAFRALLRGRRRLGPALGFPDI